MIYTVPENKKIYYNKVNHSLNESSSSFFDELYNEFEYDDDIFINDLIAERLKKNSKHVTDLLYQLDVKNYELNIDLNEQKVIVNVHNNLYLPNKNLDKINFKIFRFGIVDGNVNYSNNNLTDWSKFPYQINGNCYANLNKLTSFDNAPHIDGILYAEKQKCKTVYPLTNENYRRYLNNDLNEKLVYLVNDNKFGILRGINEKLNKCIVECNNKKRAYNLNEVDYFGNIDKLFL